MIYLVCAINRAIFFTFEWFNPVLPKWCKLPTEVICNFLGVARNQNVVLYYE